MAIHSHNSPLRYPGGKAILAKFIGDLLRANELNGCHFIELFAGGSGAAIKLLTNQVVERITLNDADFHIYAFWMSALNETEQFINLINEVNITIDEWNIQKTIFENAENHTILEVGFATFF